MSTFLADFSRALDTAITFDNQLQANASEISSEYASLAALAVRQVMGSLDITVGQDSQGDWNTSDVKVYMKNFDPVGGSGGSVFFLVSLSDFV